MIEAVAAALGDMTEELVVVGGAAVPLLVTDPAVRDIRPTEDIITLFDGRPELTEEVQQASQDVRRFVEDHLRDFAEEDGFQSAILGYLPPDDVGQSRFPIIMERMHRIAGV